MLSENIFKTTLAVSLIAHGVVFWKVPFFREISFIPEKRIEISYCQAGKEKQLSVYKEKNTLNTLAPVNDKVTVPNIPKEMFDFKMKNESLNSKLDPKIPSVKAVNLTNIQNEYKRNPTQINRYYFEVWEKIRHAAYQQLFSDRSLFGEVRLVFSVSKTGQVSTLDVVENKSQNLSLALKKAGAASVKNAAPFSTFPKDLNKNQEFFDIIISFEPR